MPLVGSGFLTEGVLGPQGAAAEGVETALHYGDGLDNPKNNAFRAAFKAKAGREADVYAVQGYDSAQLLGIGLDAVKGNIETRRRSTRRCAKPRSTARAARSASPSRRRSCRSRAGRGGRRRGGDRGRGVGGHGHRSLAHSTVNLAARLDGGLDRRILADLRLPPSGVSQQRDRCGIGPHGSARCRAAATSRSGGGVSQIGMAYGQRRLNRQPCGRLSGLGTTPG